MHCIDFPVVLVDVYYHMPQRRVEEEHLFDARRVSYSFLRYLRTSTSVFVHRLVFFIKLSLVSLYGVVIT